MYVCVCNRVTDKQVREACNNGAVSIECLQRQLKLGTCCGRCRDCAQQVMRSVQVEQAFETLPATA